MIWLTAALWGFLAAATITDVARQQIPNSITYPGMIAAFVLRGLLLGWPGVEDGLKGWAACGAIMVVCYVLLGIGGGDVKLIAMIGAFLGLYPGFEALLWTLVLGGIFGVCVLIWHVGAGNLIRGFFRHLSLMWQAKAWVPLQSSEREILQLPLFLAPAALIAAMIVGWPNMKPKTVEPQISQIHADLDKGI